MTEFTPKFLNVGNGENARRIAVRQEPGRQQGGQPGLFWLSGFKSDMRGTKIEALAAWAREHGRACVRFDYSGHGESGGDFAEGTIGRWLEEARAVFDACCEGPQILVGSSMGGWLALLLARELRQRASGAGAGSAQDNATRQGAFSAEVGSGSAQENATRQKPTVAGLVLIAPAVDFTDVLMWRQFPPDVRRVIEEKGAWARPSQYSDEPYLITRKLIDEGRAHLLLGGLIETGCPVRILQGVQDPDVPWTHAVELVSRIAQDDVVLTLVKDGDHRLSRPEDIERLVQVVAEFG